MTKFCNYCGQELLDRAICCMKCNTECNLPYDPKSPEAKEQRILHAKTAKEQRVILAKIATKEAEIAGLGEATSNALFIIGILTSIFIIGILLIIIALWMGSETKAKKTKLQNEINELKMELDL